MRLPSVPNFRDVADTVPGLRRGRLYRSDLVADPDPADAAYIRSCGIGLVVDLRGERERECEHRRNSWFMDKGAAIACFDVAGRADPASLASALRAGDGAVGAHALMRQIFRQFPGGAMPALDALSLHLASSQVPVVVHCAAGKDRTGFVVASLLRALEIAPQHIEADFLASRGRIHQRTRDHSRKAMRSVQGEAMEEEAPEVVAGVDPSYLASTWDEIVRSHGDFGTYLGAVGIDRTRIAAIRKALLMD